MTKDAWKQRSSDREMSRESATGQRSNQLNYVPTRQINKMRNNQCLCGFAQIAYRTLFAQNDPNCWYSSPNRP
jgi:hypothetical protein